MKLFFLLAAFMSSGVHATPEERTVHFGHNVTSTSDTLAKSQCTFGLQIAGCGLTDNVTIGLSSWMIYDYKIGNIGARYRFAEDAEGNAWAIQVSYFKNLRKVPHKQYLKRPYEMEAVWIEWIRTLRVAPHYRLHANLHTNYYIDDEMPFSLRRPIPDRNSGQINLTLLHEVDLIKRWFLFAEMGFLDLIQPEQYLHAGLSVGRSGKTYHWHVGYSMSATIRALATATKRNDYQQDLRETTAGYSQHISRDKARRDYGLHPEFSLQFFF